MNRSIRRGIVAVVAAALALSACGSNSNAGNDSSGDAQSTSTVTMKYAGVGGTAAAGIWVAIARGYFREQGVNLEWVPCQGLDCSTLVTTGNAQIADIGLNAALYNSALTANAFKLAAATNVTVPGSTSLPLVVREDLVASGRYKQASDLKGMTIGVGTLPGGTGFNINRFLESGGLTVRDVTIKEGINFPDQAVALKNKSVDAVLSVQPLATLAEIQGVGRIVLKDGDIIPGFPLSLALNTKFASENPDAARKFFLAFLKGQRDVIKGLGPDGTPKEHDEILRILSESGQKLGLDVLTAMEKRGGLMGFAANGGADYDRWIPEMQTFLKTLNVLQGEVTDFSTMVDTSFIDQAVKEVGPLCGSTPDYLLPGGKKC